MSNIKSTLVFKSNLWPCEYSKEYWDHICDPEAIFALDKECRNNRVSGGYSVDEVRKRASMPCSINNKFVFGTRFIKGEKKLVCICDNIDCKHYDICSKYKEK